MSNIITTSRSHPAQPYGVIRNYMTGEFIRTATHEDWTRHVMRADKVTGKFIDTETACTVYCDGASKCVEDQIDEEENFFRR